MSDQELNDKLQQIVLQHLTSTRHGARTPNYQAMQFQRIKTDLASLYLERPDLLQFLQKDISLIAVSQLTRPQVDNIGVASYLCLNYLSEVEKHQAIEPAILKEIISRFLELAGHQSRAELRRRDRGAIADHKQQTSRQYIDIFNRFISESVSEMAMQQRNFTSQIAAATEKIDLALEAAKNAAIDAEKAAKSTQNAADSASAAKTAADEVSQSLSDMEMKLTTAKRHADRAAGKARDATKTAEGMIPNMLTVLGIFIGVVVAVVACYLTILLEQKDVTAIAADSIPLAFMFAWMMGHILVMFVFLLLYLMSKLTDRTMACHCRYYEKKKQQCQLLANKFRKSGEQERRDASKQKSSEVGKQEGHETGNEGPEATLQKAMHECIECKNGCKSLIRLKYRFPYIFWINVAFIVGYAVLCVVHLIDLYYAEHINNIIQYNWLTLLLFAVMVIAAILAAAIIITKKISKESPK